MDDLVIEGNAYLNGRLNKCCIGIENGKISAIKKIIKGERQLDFGDKLILPAGIDVHVHFRDPGMTYKEDFESGTQAAAFGGISCIFDMPNTKPPVLSQDILMEKLASVKKKAYIDYGLYSSILPNSNIKAISKVCSAFKIYLASTTGKLLFPDDRNLTLALKHINNTQKIPAIHAESERIIQKEKKNAKPAKNLNEHLINRPNKAEATAISRLLNIAKRWVNKDKNTTNIKSELIPSINDHIHICHVSSLDGVNLIKKYKKNIKELTQNNTIITAEVTPHHLILNEKYEGNSLGKVNPPLRTQEDQTALWSALEEGTIDILASDHAPHTYDEKTQNFASVPSGLPGVETMLPLMLSLVKHKKLSLSTLTSAISTNPAKLFGLPKGDLSVGYDGDLIVVDFYKEDRIKTKDLHSKCGWTPFEKKDAIFPILTLVRGNIIIKDDNLEADPGWGKFFN